MDQIKQLTNTIDQATSDSLPAPSQELYGQVEKILVTRADMSKHLVAHCMKRLMIKNKKVLYLVMDMLEYLSYQSELPFFSQISTKDFLLRISSLLQSKDLDEVVIQKVLCVIRCWEELFRPHQDLLPMFFQFYDGLQKKGFDQKKDYVSPYRPKELKKYPTKADKKPTGQPKQEKSQKTGRDQTLLASSIRDQIILTNEVIDGCNPSDGVSTNPLLTDLMDGLKQAEKRLLKVINQENNEKAIQQAIALNDDLIITFRRYKDLQKNRKPQPFVKTELASNYVAKEQPRVAPKVQQKSASIFDDFEAKPAPVANTKKESKKQQPVNIIDLDFDNSGPAKPQPPAPKPSSLFDMLDLNAPPAMNTMSTTMQPVPMNTINLMGAQTYGGNPTFVQPVINPMNPSMVNPAVLAPVPPPALYQNMAGGLNLLGNLTQPTATQPINQVNTLAVQSNFATQADFKQYTENSLTDLSDWFAKKL